MLDRLVRQYASRFQRCKLGTMGSKAMRQIRVMPLVAVMLAAGSAAVWPQQSAAQQTATQAPASTQEQLRRAEELDQLVAPIALYPDSLLAEVLMASTYPLEVVEADRWVQANKKLSGDQLKQAVDKQSWDDSIKSLVATPAALNMMSSKLDWTQKLGDAVLAQQADVMDAIQRLRARAQKEGKLATTQQQKVSTAAQGEKQVIVVEPVDPNVIYVPAYNPAVVYGAWPYPAYPPYYFPPPPSYYAGAAIATGIAFSVGFAVGAWATHDRYWGGGVHWGNNNININRPININNVDINKNWQHNSVHRHGVRYTDNNVAQKFAKNDIHAGSKNRVDFRGHDGQQVVRPGGDRASRGPEHRDHNIGAGDGNRPHKSSQKSLQPHRSQGTPARDHAFANVDHGGAARAHAERGRASMGDHQAHAGRVGGGGGRGRR